VQTAVARARVGEGPTLLECVTYRLRGHNESWRPTELRDQSEIMQWQAKDPIPRMRVNLLERGILSNELVRDIDLEVAAEIEDAVSFAENSPSPDPMEIYRDVYAPDASDLVVGRQA